ncbi:Sir2 family NAD+-dependent deacetylase [Nisaea sp.]|uniref:Sir2 family NAD+-dependent deacetylase n=1 Tax=Nisaea sp. TaxID=2024842 RepID=UPI0032ED7E27
MQLNLSPDASIVILTGAGISKESGLDTFRDADGIWSKVNLEDVATPEGYLRNPAMVHAFYNTRRRSLTDSNVVPNAAHAALARLERDWQGEVLLVTQNIDDLHERAGSSRLLHMHGEMLKARCERTGEIFDWRDDLTLTSRNPTTNEAGALRPHVVWFGEMPLYMEEIYEALSDADLFISIGTSGNVYPAAGFVQEARMHGAHTTELNLEPSEGATLFAEKRYGPASEIVPAYVEELLGGV